MQDQLLFYTMFQLIIHPENMFKKGYTIIELLIYMALLSGFILILGQLFFSILDTQLQSQSNSAVNAEGQFLISRLNYDIRRATSLTVPAALGQTDTSLSLVINGVAYIYTISGSDLVLTVSGISQPLNSRSVSVSDFRARRLGNPDPSKPSVLVDFSITSQTVSLNQNAKTRSYQTTVNLQ